MYFIASKDPHICYQDLFDDDDDEEAEVKIDVNIPIIVLMKENWKVYI